MQALTGRGLHQGAENFLSIKAEQDRRLFALTHLVLQSAMVDAEGRAGNLDDVVADRALETVESEYVDKALAQRTNLNGSSVSQNSQTGNQPTIYEIEMLYALAGMIKDLAGNQLDRLKVPPYAVGASRQKRPQEKIAEILIPYGQHRAPSVLVSPRPERMACRDSLTSGQGQSSGAGTGRAAVK